jgi:hypothetical protein
MITLSGFHCYTKITFISINLLASVSFEESSNNGSSSSELSDVSEIVPKHIVLQHDNSKYRVCTFEEICKYLAPMLD